jgi:hypothetical protein
LGWVARCVLLWDAYRHGVDEPGTRPAPSSAYVIGDVHGHRTELVAALREAGLAESDGSWCGGTARVWFLGDFFDRGEDGVGVVELVMSLAEEAQSVGGSVRALLGNHEILTLGMHRFGDTEVPAEFGVRSFGRSWRLNGGQESDQAKLTERHLDWLTSLPVMARVDDYLLMHSDTVEYFGWGDTVEEINDAVHAVVNGDDIEQWWECWRRMTTRYAFRGQEGTEMADKVLAALGGRRIVHGHSVIADQLGIHPVDVVGPCLYADGRALGVDGGLFVGGPCLIVPLTPVDEVDDDEVIEVVEATGDTETTEDTVTAGTPVEVIEGAPVAEEPGPDELHEVDEPDRADEVDGSGVDQPESEDIDDELVDDEGGVAELVDEDLVAEHADEQEK